MDKKYFPLFMDISEKKIVVIGGGVIATRRVNTLMQFTTRIEVVAPEVTLELEQLMEAGQIVWLCETYHPQQIAGADMVIAATNRPEVNHQVKKDCEALMKQEGRQIFVSVIDNRELCDFYFPSIVQSGETVIGINSGGAFPGETKKLRKRIEEALKCESIYWD